MRRSEVWWVEFDLAVGSEIRNRPPAMIMSNDAANRHLSRVVVPPTSSTGKVYPGEAVINVAGQGSKAMADQIVAADKSRLKGQLGTLSKVDMLAVEDAIEVHLALPR